MHPPLGEFPAQHFPLPVPEQVLNHGKQGSGEKWGPHFYSGVLDSAELRPSAASLAVADFIMPRTGVLSVVYCRRNGKAKAHVLYKHL